jgi:protein involved in polysaccharide export with SLBB domain
MHHSPFLFPSLLLLAALGIPHGADGAESSTAQKPVAFRATNVQIAAIQANASGQRVIGVNSSADSEVDDLSEKRETLEGEIRFAKAKLDAAQKRLSIQTAAGNLEQAEKANEEVKEWNSRLATAKAQLAQVEDELAASSGSQVNGDSGVVVPGENLEVVVLEDSSFNGRYQVRRGGYIILPQVGRIAVAGKTVNGAEASVKRALQASQLQKATVLIERISGSDIETGPLIYLSGEFKHPRPYRIPAGTAPTLVGVLLSSGGATNKADLTRVRVMRVVENKSVVEEVNVQKILEGGGLASDITLTEGDVVTIPVGEQNLVYVTGNVKRQGSYQLTPGERLSAYGAILQSGGFARFADLRKVHILRAMPDGTKAKIPVDVKSIQSGRRPDVILESNDILVVPEKFFSF